MCTSPDCVTSSPPLLLSSGPPSLLLSHLLLRPHDLSTQKLDIVVKDLNWTPAANHLWEQREKLESGAVPIDLHWEGHPRSNTVIGRDIIIILSLGGTSL